MLVVVGAGSCSAWKCGGVLWDGFEGVCVVSLGFKALCTKRGETQVVKSAMLFGCVVSWMPFGVCVRIRRFLKQAVKVCALLSTQEPQSCWLWPLYLFKRLNYFDSYATLVG